MNTTTAYSEKVQRWTAQAKELGLEVEVKEDSDDLFDRVEVKIRRPRVEPTNMLEVVQQAEEIWVYSSRMYGKGLWRHIARSHNYSDPRGRSLRLRSVKYAIEGLAR